MNRSRVLQRFKTRLHNVPLKKALRDGQLNTSIDDKQLIVTGVTIHTNVLDWHYEFPSRFLMEQGDALDVEYKMYFQKEDK